MGGAISGAGLDEPIMTDHKIDPFPETQVILHPVLAPLREQPWI
jgi:hypothetical protein